MRDPSAQMRMAAPTDGGPVHPGATDDPNDIQGEQLPEHSRSEVRREHVDIVVRQQHDVALAFRDCLIVRLCQRAGISNRDDFVRNIREKPTVERRCALMLGVIDRT